MRIWSLIATVVIGCFASQAMAQGNAAAAPAQSAAKIPVAVVDVGHILKNHPTMKNEIEAIKAQMEAADKEMTNKRNEILAQMEQLREKYTEGTPEYEREEKAIAERDTAFRLEIVKRRKEFDKANASVLYRVYSDLKNVLKYASETHGIQSVVRVNGTREDLDPTKPETVQMLMSQEVIYFSPAVDLTDWVLKAMATQTAQRQGAPTR